MSTVKVLQRDENKLEVLKLAREYLANIASTISKEKWFPKRARWQFAEKLNNFAQEICFKINGANNIYVMTKEDFTMKRALMWEAEILIENSLQIWEFVNLYNSNIPENKIMEIINNLTILRGKTRNWIKTSFAQNSQFINLTTNIAEEKQ